MVTERDSWLRMTVEEPLEPEIPICDPHHHLWDRPAREDRPGNRYLLEDLLQDIGDAHNIVQTVFVECRSMYRKGGPAEMQAVGETEFVQGIAAQSASGQYGTTMVAAGIVGHADLMLGKEVSAVLGAHVAASSNRFRGIRHSTTWDASMDTGVYTSSRKGLLLDSKFREGFSCLQRYGLSFDAWLYHTQLPELADLARAYPDTQIIVDHIGGLLGTGPYAGKREEVFQQWQNGITELSACSNVVVKLGGLGMPVCGFGWNEWKAPPRSTEIAEAMAPYYHWCIEKFGVDRCMFESNFPVDKASYSYTVMWNAFKRIAKDFSAAEKAALFHDTAVRVYRLSGAV
ncbi:MAG: amidohydrolase family protein [Dehalococcoidales bacterium]|nr:MAG: amidohydrolase family protein [Dehalococcoidales bacterium]